MSPSVVNPEADALRRILPKSFNKKKGPIVYNSSNNKTINEIQNLSRAQCLGKLSWPEISKVSSWMMTAETATFMKVGGLGMIASELPEIFNETYSDKGEEIWVVTPLYIGDTGKKKAFIKGDEYFGAEKASTKIEKVDEYEVLFFSEKGILTRYKVGVFVGKQGNTNYIFLGQDKYFSINPHKNNPSAQDGCYVLNENGIDEVERFAFFSKAVYGLLEKLFTKGNGKVLTPNVLIANDWHSGALSGLMKYLTAARKEVKEMDDQLAEKMRSLPIIHLAHHLGYQGWDYDNTARILNSLYEDCATLVFKNARAIKNSNPRATNTLLVHDCYNQASCNFHLADRVVTVSRNYLEEVSKELGFGYDFRDILKMRKDHRNFFGIVNGYNKKLISPNKSKIEEIDKYFGEANFKFFDESHLDAKLHNKREFITLLSKIATDPEYKKKVIPLIDTYKFEDISDVVKKAEKVPMFCATSRLTDQKGYDIAAQAIINLIHKHCNGKQECPIFILGGAGDEAYFGHLKNLKDKVAKFNKIAAKRIFVFRGYKDEFAYAIQLASDFYMMPSRFEPCGLSQMEAMAKGSLPIATSTGGLVDTIIDGEDGFRTKVFFSQDNKRIYGNNMTAKRLRSNVNAYAESLLKALEVFYKHPEKIKEMTVAAMKKDFSWDVKGGSLQKYHTLLRTGHI
ncbi:MAG: glycogen/starch synthase [Lactobacillus sp.]|jgi:glycogen synthase|nr:glycogen/starch synthase [Lactobacillus sp.]